MDKIVLPYKYICFEGNIGAGKTSFCERISKMYSSKLILEQFNDNPFLPLFYDDPARYAFPVEVFFMTERYKQQQELHLDDMFIEHVFADYTFVKTLLFAKNSLPPQEFKIFLQLFQALSNSIPQPDIMIYFHRSVSKLKEQIDYRGREIEKNISLDYLKEIQDVYFDYFKSETAYPIVIIDVENMDFVRSKKDFDEVMRILSFKYNPGVHRISIA